MKKSNSYNFILFIKYFLNNYVTHIIVEKISLRCKTGEFDKLTLCIKSSTRVCIPQTSNEA